ncbi:MAG: universal stress protein [Deltaproteobacteria bacterium]|nr:universal stress protein [Deltaproteobacteria bacterium]
MSHIGKILAALAFSKYSPAIFEYSSRLAMELNAMLLVAHIINIRDVEAISSVESLGYSVSTDDYIKGVKEERMAELEKIIAEGPLPRDKIKILIKVGHPFDALMKIINEEGVDMAVIGTKGRSDLEHVMLGSVAEKIIRHSPIPVLSYPTKRH